MAPAKRAKKPAAPLEPLTIDDLRTLRGDISARFAAGPPAWWEPMTDRPAVLAFDVGKTGACALVKMPGKVADSPRWTYPPQASYVETLKDKGDLSEAWSEQVVIALDSLAAMIDPRWGHAEAAIVIIEDVFVGRASPNIQAAMTASRRVGALVASAAGRFPVVRVMSASWQHRMLGKMPATETGERRDWNKRRSIELAREMYGDRIVNEHVADASLLATWGYRGPTFRVEAKSKAKGPKAPRADAVAADSAVGAPSRRRDGADAGKVARRAKERGAANASKLEGVA